MQRTSSPLFALCVASVSAGDRVVDLRDVQLSFRDVLALAAALRANPSKVEMISLRGCGIGTYGIAVLVDVLHLCTNLSILCLNDNNVGDAGAVVLAEADFHIDVDLAKNGITDVGERALSFATNTRVCDRDEWDVREEINGGKGGKGVSDGRMLTK